MRKRHAAAQGVVAGANLDTIFQREIFFQVDPMTLDHLDHTDIQELLPSGLHVDLDPTKYLQYLPELEQEIFFLVYEKKKNQKDIAKLLELSQPTVSYRYRRVLAKFFYLMTLTSVDVAAILDRIEFLKETERPVLLDLFFYTNQEMVGKKHEIRQSSVKWIFVKTKRRIAELEQREPERWTNTYGLFVLLERFLNIRVLH